jgi:hypothetical protein
VAQNAVVALGIVGAGTNNARLAGILRNLSSYYYKEPTLLYLVGRARLGLGGRRPQGARGGGKSARERAAAPSGRAGWAWANGSPGGGPGRARASGKPPGDRGTAEGVGAFLYLVGRAVLGPGLRQPQKGAGAAEGGGRDASATSTGRV